MNILLTNDDGIDYPGITALEEELEKAWPGKIFVSAPLVERSATSQAITIYGTIQVIRRSERVLIVEGYPSDCVNIALYGGFFPKIDLVISGINKGVNLGHDVFYSGTVAAARHAAIHGVPAIAISHDCLGEEGDFVAAARLLRQMLEEKALDLEPGEYYNINYPARDHGRPRGMVWVPTGPRQYAENYEIKNLPEKDHFLFYLGGSLLDWDQGVEGYFDYQAVRDGYVTVTPLSLDPTDQGHLGKYRGKQDWRDFQSKHSGLFADGEA